VSQTETYQLILLLAHEKRRTALSCRRLDFDEVLEAGHSIPRFTLHVAFFDQEVGEDAFGVFVCDIGDLAAIPGSHVGVVRVLSNGAADGACPVCFGKVWQRGVKVAEKLEDL